MELQRQLRVALEAVATSPAGSAVGASLRTIQMRSPAGDRRVEGAILEPADNTDPSVVIFCGDDSLISASVSQACAVAKQLLPLRISLFVPSLMELGAQGGRTIEPADLRTCESYLRNGDDGGFYRKVSLWGYSEGAGAALRYAANEPTLGALVCDSAYSDPVSSLPLPDWAASPLYGLAQLAQALPGGAAAGGGGGGTKGAGEAEFLREAAARCHVPVLFLHGADDAQLPESHARALWRDYAGERQLLVIRGATRESPRPPAVIAKGVLLIARALRLQDSELADAFAALEEAALGVSSVSC